MLLMCLNGWGGKLHDGLIPYLQSASPDVLCLQEVVHTPASSKEWLTYKDNGVSLPQRSNFFAEVCEALPQHIAFFCPAARGDLWDGDKRVDSQWGIATFVRKTIPIIAQKQGFVHGCFRPNGYGEHPRSRSAHAVRLFDFKQRQPVTICHMHGLRDPDGKHDTEARLVQAERLAALSMAVSEEGDMRVVCGDFNVLPDSQTLELLRKYGYIELVTELNFTDTRTSHYKKPGRFADYMCVSSETVYSHFDVVRDPEVSDHCPLILEIG